jgi:hypothetical protein
LKWRVNKDQALELIVDGQCVGGVWRGAWRDDRDQKVDGYLAARWHPYRRVGYFVDAKVAKAAVEKAVGEKTT